MSVTADRPPRNARGPAGSSVAADVLIRPSSFVQLTPDDIRKAFAVPASFPPILSLDEAASLVKLRPQTLKRKVSEGLYAASVVRAKPLRFWRDRFVAEVMR